MVGLVTLIGVIMVALGAVYLVKPQVMKKSAKFWTNTIRLYLGGVLSILIGIIFLSAASECNSFWFILLVGILSLAKGLFAFILGPIKVKNIVGQIIKKPAKTLRVFAIVILVLGVMIIYSA